MANTDECASCGALIALFEKTPKDGKSYYLMTEVFVLLHDGKDYCSKEKKQNGETK